MSGRVLVPVDALRERERVHRPREARVLVLELESAVAELPAPSAHTYGQPQLRDHVPRLTQLRGVVRRKPTEAPTDAPSGIAALDDPRWRTDPRRRAPRDVSTGPRVTTRGARAALWLALAFGLGWGVGLGDHAGAQPRRGELVLSTDSGRVLRARLSGGAIAELDGAMEVRLSGATARVIFQRANEGGLTASARAEDVEVRLAREVWTSDGTVGLDRTAHVTLRSVGAREATIDARGLGLSVGPIRIPRDALALDARARGAASPAPDAWSRAGAAPRRVMTTASPLLRTPGGRALGESLGYGVEVAILEEAGDWTRVAIEDSGLRVLGWARSGDLTEPAPRASSRGGGGGLAAGRIGLSACTTDGARTLHARAPTPIHPAASGRGRLVVVGAGASVVVRDLPGALVPVVELAGVRRVGRCAQPIGWVRRDALTEDRVEPLDPGPIEE